MPVHRAIDALQRRELVIVVDERGRGRGDLVAPARTVTDEQVNFMAAHGRGLVSVAASAARIDALRLRPMAATWGVDDRAFTVSVEAAVGTTTGISTRERAHTIRTLAAVDARPEDLTSPGHIFPRRAAAGGLRERHGRLEAAVALIAAAGLGDTAALCEILDDDGELADLRTIETLVFEHGLRVVAIGEIVHALGVGPHLPLGQRSSHGIGRHDHG
ncbi:MAG: 3,4-dihydroxy-2-butanone-4-phosphate synthase [Polyangia bacterium]